MKVLIFAPHPDDELIGCGGAILNHLSKNDEVSIVFVSSGDSESKAIREEEAKKIYEKTSVKCYFMKEKDRFIEYNERTLKKIIEIIRRIQPETIYFPHENEEDHDHKEVYELVNEACWMANENIMLNLGKTTHIKTVFNYEVWTPIKKPNYYLDISDYINKKICLLKRYSSQIKFKRYDLAAKGLSQYRGNMHSGYDFSEAFICRMQKN